jgi:hypothetical protein
VLVITRERTLLVAALFLLLVTAVAIQPAVKYGVAHDSERSSFDGSHPGWESSTCGVNHIGSGAFALEPNPRCPRPWAGARLPRTTAWTAVEINARIAVSATENDLDQGLTPLAGIELIHDNGRPFFREVEPLFSPSGDETTLVWQKFFQAPLKGDALRVRFIMPAGADPIVVKNATVHTRPTRPGFFAVQVFLFVLWCTWLIAAAVMVVAACRRRWVAVLAFVIAVAAIAGAVLPRTGIYGPVDRLVKPVVSAQPPGAATSPAPSAYFEDVFDLGAHPGRIAKMGHFIGFFVIAAALLLAGPRRGVLTIVGIVVALAIGTEIVQGFNPYRSPTVRDALLDLWGAGTGWGCAFLFVWTLRRLRRGPADNES